MEITSGAGLLDAASRAAVRPAAHAYPGGAAAGAALGGFAGSGLYPPQQAPAADMTDRLRAPVQTYWGNAPVPVSPGRPAAAGEPYGALPLRRLRRQ